MIEKGMAAMARHDWRAAALQLRAGLRHIPDDLQARRTLAELYVAARRPLQARSILTDGLAYADKAPLYVRDTLNFLLSREEDSAVAVIASHRLKAFAPAPETLAAYRMAAASASFFRGHFDEAESWLASPGMSFTAARLLQARIEWERGYRDLALAGGVSGATRGGRDAA